MSRPMSVQIDLPQEMRKQMVSVLNENLADAIDLSLQAKQAHWNVKGPQFFQLHELFDKVYDEATGWVDLIAERAVQLGGLAGGTLQTVHDKTRLEAYPVSLSAGADHVRALSAALARFGASIRAAISTAGKAGDDGTADLFTEVSRSADKMLWFVESHLHGD